MNIELVGTIAAVITVIYTCLGIPSQVVLNHRSKSTLGLSKATTFLSWLTFCIWVLYGTLKGDWYIVVSNLPGVIFVSIILVQFVLYSRYRKQE